MNKRSVLKIALVLVSVAILFAAFFAVNTFAEVKESTFGADADNLRWAVDTATGELVISLNGDFVSGEMEDFTSASSTPWYEYKDSITKLTVNEGVTSIGANAFYGYDSLVAVTLPETLEDINSYAFYGCNTLRNLTLPSSLTAVGDFAFCGCYSIRQLTLGDGLQTVGASAFRGCYSIESLELPDSVTSIGDNAFSGCHSLKWVKTGSGLASVGVESFFSCGSLERIILTSADVTFAGRDSVTADAWIYGHSGSSAQTYARTYGKKFVVIPEYTDASISVEFNNIEARADETVVFAVSSDAEPLAAEIALSYEVVKYASGKPMTVYTDVAILTFDGVATAHIAASQNGVILKVADLTSDEDVKVISASLTNSAGDEIFAPNTDDENGTIIVTVNYRTGFSKDNLTVNGDSSDIIGYVSETGAITFETSYLTEFSVDRLRGIAGDVNGDRKVTAEDVAILRRYLAGWANYSEIDTDAANVNTDSTVDDDDVVLVRLYLAGRKVALVNNTDRIDPNHEHDYVTVAAVTATCTHSGLSEGVACSVCGKVTVAQGYIPALAHKYENGRCKLCFASSDVSEGLEFAVCEGGYKVMGIGTCEDTVVVIPSSYNGEAVVAVADRAFYENDSIVSVIIPSSVKSIGELAFYKNYALESVVISDGVEKIYKKAFEYCTALESVVIPDSVMSLGTGAFMGCYNLTEATLSESITKFQEDVFFGCYKLKTLNITSPATYLGGWFAYDCESLDTINYAGTTEQWEKIFSGDYWDTNTGEYIVNCSDGRVYCHRYGEWFSLENCLYAHTCEICGETENKYRHSYDTEFMLLDGVLTSVCGDCNRTVMTYENESTIFALDFDTDIKSIATEAAAYDGFTVVSDQNTYETIDNRSVWDVGNTTFIDYDKAAFDGVDRYSISFDMYLGEDYSDTNTVGNSVFSFLGGYKNGGKVSGYSQSYNWVVKYVHYTDSEGNKVRKLATVNSNDSSKLNSSNSVDIALQTWVNVYAVADVISGKMSVYIDGKYIGNTSVGVIDHSNSAYGDLFSLRFSDETSYDTHFDNLRISALEGHEYSEWEQGTSECEFIRVCLECGEKEIKYEHTGTIEREITSDAVYDKCSVCGLAVKTLAATDTVLKLDFVKTATEELESYSYFTLNGGSDNNSVSVDGRTAWKVDSIGYIKYDSLAFSGADMFNISFDVKFSNSTAAVRDSSIFSFMPGFSGSQQMVSSATYMWQVKFVSVLDRISTKAVNGTTPTYSTKAAAQAAQNESAILTSNNSVEYNVGDWVTISLMCDMANKKAYIFVDGDYIGTSNIPNHSSSSYGGYFTMRLFDVTSYGAYIDNFKISEIEPTEVKPEFEVSMNGIDSMLTKLTTSDDFVTLVATEDTYVRGGSYADTNFGSAEEIAFKATTASDDSTSRISLLKFDLGELDTSDINTALLQLNCILMERADDPTTVYVYSCDPDSWEEEAVTYNTVPNLGDPVAQTVVYNEGAVSVDITDYIKGKSGEISFYLAGEPTNSRRIEFSSTENGDIVPSVVLNYGGANFIASIPYDTVNPWAKAMNDVKEWLVRWENIKQGGESDVETIVPNTNEYTLTVGAADSTNTNGANTEYTNYATRNISTLIDFTADNTEPSLYDEYGGLMIESLKQEATGYFYTKKVGDRWWTIDPLGYPFYRVACVQIINGSSQNQKDATIATHGSVSAWAESATERLRELGYNSTGGWSDISTLSKVTKPLAQTKILYVLRDYCNTLELNISTGGSTELVGGVLPVFDPAFESYADSYVKDGVSGYETSSYIYGWMSDNELPDSLGMLDSSLSFDVSDERFIYSYATAWTFMYLKTGNINVSMADVTQEYRKEYRAMVYDKYFDIVSSAIDKYAPDHQYLGCRFVSNNYRDESVMRVAGYWCDAVTFNYYGVWTPNEEFIANVQRWLAKPFIVTEWYAKGMDACTPENGLTNKSGAGWTVATQDDRGKFYQNYALQLLECKGCVGFDWFQYWDNDPLNASADTSNTNSNKGIYSTAYDEYTVLTEYMDELNNQKYTLIDFFDVRNAK